MIYSLSALMKFVTVLTGFLCLHRKINVNFQRHRLLNENPIPAMADTSKRQSM